ncbi:hypothetical protein N431DRAFT_456389 [Stipitochalara longipes BDJ]|nr:hypothetical protein N431DRAFT_456389 [Stipitochalara longipes BDJ]
MKDNFAFLKGQLNPELSVDYSSLQHHPTHTQRNRSKVVDLSPLRDRPHICDMGSKHTRIPDSQRTQEYQAIDPTSPTVTLPQFAHFTESENPARNFKHPVHLNDIIAAPKYLQETYEVGEK